MAAGPHNREVQVLEQTETSRIEGQDPVASSELTTILAALTAFQRGNATVRLPAEWNGLFAR